MPKTREVHLLPCPFCGAAACQPTNASRPGRTPLWEIDCSVFCVCMRRGTRAEVIRCWNTRNPTPQGGVS